MSEDKLVVFILGPTAVGKTEITIQLAEKFRSEIISSDSRQFYGEMSIGTAKPTSKQLSRVRHHLIDSISIQEEYNVSDFEQDALKIIDNVLSEKAVVFITGGSGLYFHAITHGIDDEIPGNDTALRRDLNEILEKDGIEKLQSILSEEDPATFEKIDILNPHRIIRAIEIRRLSGKSIREIGANEPKKRRFKMLKIGIEMSREELYNRINTRVDEMITNGLIEEAGNLIGFKRNNALKTVGYRELFQYFEGELSKDEAIEKIKQNTRNYAKRQMTWFRRYDDIHWFRPDEEEKIIELINQNINQP